MDESILGTELAETANQIADEMLNRGEDASDIHKIRLLASWRVRARNVETGEIIYDEESPNIVVKTGRDDMLRLLFGLAGSSLVSLAAGASSTAATVNDTRLVYEHILNGARKTLTNTSGAALSATDILDDTYSEGGCNYYKKITVRATFTSGDANNGHPFQEYGLFTTTVCPGTPTGSVPTMYNRYVTSSPITKTASIELIVDTTIRC